MINRIRINQQKPLQKSLYHLLIPLGTGIFYFYPMKTSKTDELLAKYHRINVRIAFLRETSNELKLQIRKELEIEHGKNTAK